MVTEGDVVFMKVNFSGTHSRVFMAPVATKKPFTIPGFARFTLKNGKVSEGFAVADLYQITKRIQYP